MQISDELELATVRLTAAADKRLGVSVVPTQRKKVIGRRTYPAIVVVPPHNVALLTAPFTGLVHYQGPGPLVVGTEVRQGQSLFSCEPMLLENYALGLTQQESLRATRLGLEQSKAAIQTRINNALVEVDASRIDLRRAEQLFEQKVGSRKRVDDARARSQLAEEVLESARRELGVLQRVTHQSTAPAAPITLSAPLSGIISKVPVATGQSVTAGQPLLELTNLKRLWLRVRMPQSESREVQLEEPATLNIAGIPKRAQPTVGPPSADPMATTVDLYYLLENSSLNPDQRTEVSLPLSGKDQQLVVPTEAILYDVYGGAWVYVRKQPFTYQRVRVQVDNTDSGQAVLSSGLATGVEVVTHGAAELFGVEFGND